MKKTDSVIEMSSNTWTGFKYRVVLFFLGCFRLCASIANMRLGISPLAARSTMVLKIPDQYRNLPAAKRLEEAQAEFTAAAGAAAETNRSARADGYRNIKAMEESSE